MYIFNKYKLYFKGKKNDNAFPLFAAWNEFSADSVGGWLILFGQRERRVRALALERASSSYLLHTKHSTFGSCTGIKATLGSLSHPNRNLSCSLKVVASPRKKKRIIKKSNKFNP